MNTTELVTDIVTGMFVAPPPRPPRRRLFAESKVYDFLIAALERQDKEPVQDAKMLPVCRFLRSRCLVGVTIDASRVALYRTGRGGAPAELIGHWALADLMTSELTFVPKKRSLRALKALFARTARDGRLRQKRAPKADALLTESFLAIVGALPMGRLAWVWQAKKAS